MEMLHSKRNEMNKVSFATLNHKPIIYSFFNKIYVNTSEIDQLDYEEKICAVFSFFTFL